MESVHQLSIDQRRERQRKIWWRAVGVSLLAHALLFLMFNGAHIPDSPFAAAGPRAGDNRAAQGTMEALALSTRPPAPIVRPQVPLPTVNPVDPIEFDPEIESDLGSMMGDQAGLDAPPGLPTGDGAGDGGTAEEGRFRVTPPTPRGMILPPTNDNLKGRTVEVWVFVDERGPGGRGQHTPESSHIGPLVQPSPDRRGGRMGLPSGPARWQAHRILVPVPDQHVGAGGAVIAPRLAPCPPFPHISGSRTEEGSPGGTGRALLPCTTSQHCGFGRGIPPRHVRTHTFLRLSSRPAANRGRRHTVL